MTRPSFTSAELLSEGYRIDEVTAFLDDIEPQVYAASPKPELIETIRNVRFNAGRRGPRFDMAEVDIYLDELEDHVRQAHPAWTGRKVSALPGVVPPAGGPQRSFATTRFRSGYAIGDVDAFLAEVEPRVRGFRPPLELVDRLRNARFVPVMLRRGYDMAEVDLYLDELQAIVTNAAR